MERLWLERLGVRPNIALSWFWQVINRKLCCIDTNHDWVCISPVPNLCLHETQHPRAKMPYQSICKYAFWWNQRTAEFRRDCRLAQPKQGRYLTLYIRQLLKNDCKRMHFSCNSSPSILKGIQKWEFNSQRSFSLRANSKNLF